MSTRSAHRAQRREETGRVDRQLQDVDAGKRRRALLLRAGAFAVFAALMLGGGTYLAASVFLGPRSNDAPAGYAPVRISMAGWDPQTINARAAQPVSLHFWDTDSAMHLSEMDPGSGGVHTFILDSEHINVAIPAEGSKDFTFTAPATPGDYDFYCDTCCGGKASPDMHGTLHVTA